MSGRWVKQGQIYQPEKNIFWRSQAAMTPTPILLGDIIRIFVGFRDQLGISRIGFVDVEATNPNKVVNISSQSILDVGEAGAFDDNGLILGDIIALDTVKQHWRMYYVGFQKVQKAKFLAFTGVAESQDGACTFCRISQSPIFDRNDESIHIIAVHRVLAEKNGFRLWYSIGEGWEIIEGLPYPRYRVSSQFSHDGLTFDGERKDGPNLYQDEYRLGRMRVYDDWDADTNNFAVFTAGSKTNNQYLTYYATFGENDRWQRHGLWLPPSGISGDWDSDSVCYPALIKVKESWLAFYNGNGMGKTGFGWAKWEQ